MSVEAVVVTPFRDEASILSDLVVSLSEQADEHGAPMTSRVALVGVDNDSKDGGAAVFVESASKAGFAGIRVIGCAGGVVTARRDGFAAALESWPTTQVVLSVDADTRPDRRSIDTAIGLVAQGAPAVSFRGTFGATFWQQTPRLAQHYAAQVGTVFFDAATAGKYATGGPFGRELFDHLGRTIVDQCFAISPAAYLRCGGYDVRLDEDGNEILHEGGRLAFALSRCGLEVVTSPDHEYVTSPRRLLAEPEVLLAGRSYTGAMRPCRPGADEPGLTAALDARANELDYEALRRYVLEHYVIFQCLSHAHAVTGLSWHVPAGTAQAVADAVAAFKARPNVSGVDAVAHARELRESLGDEIMCQWRRAGTP